MTTKFEYSSGVSVTFEGTQITSTSYSGFPSAVIIGDNVTTIGTNAFKDLSLSNVTFNDINVSVLQSIGAHAFDNTKISSIQIPNAVSVIAEYAFANCSLLTTVDIIEGSNLRSLGSHCFYKSGIFANITIPNTVMTLGEYCFYDTSVSLTTLPCSLSTIPAHCFEKTPIPSMKIPSSITHIADYAFNDCTLLATLTFVGSKLQVIGAYAFMNTAFTTVSIPNSVTDIGAHAFDGSSGGKITTVTIHNLSTLKVVADYAFYDNNISSIYLPKTLVEIGDYALANNNLSAITLLGNSLKTIGDYAFANNTSITEISIPHSVAIIGPSVFSGIINDGKVPIKITFANPTTALVVPANSFTPTQLGIIFSVINFVRHGSA